MFALLTNYTALRVSALACLALLFQSAPQVAHADPWKWHADREKGCKIWAHGPHIYDQRGKISYDKGIDVTPPGSLLWWPGPCSDGYAEGNGAIAYFWRGVPVLDQHFQNTNGAYIKKGKPTATVRPDELTVRVEDCDNYLSGGWYERLISVKAARRIDFKNYWIGATVAAMAEEIGSKRCQPVKIWRTVIHIVQNGKPVVEASNPTEHLEGTTKKWKDVYIRVLPYRKLIEIGTGRFTREMQRRRDHARAEAERKGTLILWSIAGGIGLVVLLIAIWRLPSLIEALEQLRSIVGVIAAIVVPFAVFFIPGYYDAVALFMYEWFPFSQIIVAAAALLILRLAVRGRTILGVKEKDEHVFLENIEFILVAMGLAGLGLLLAGILVGGAVANPKSFGWEAFAGLAQLAYAPGFWLAHVVGVSLLIINAPYIAASVLSLFVFHPAEETVKRSLPGKRPDYVVEQELAAVLQSQDADGEHIDALFHELPFWKRWPWEVRWKLQERRLAHLRTVVAAKTKVHREEAELGLSVLEMERVRRERAGYTGDEREPIREPQPARRERPNVLSPKPPPARQSPSPESASATTFVPKKPEPPKSWWRRRTEKHAEQHLRKLAQKHEREHKTTAREDRHQGPSHLDDPQAEEARRELDRAKNMLR